MHSIIALVHFRAYSLPGVCMQVLESKMMEIEHDIAALHAHEKMSRNAVADGEAVLHAEAVEQAEEEAAHEATEADESLLNKQVSCTQTRTSGSEEHSHARGREGRQGSCQRGAGREGCSRTGRTPVVAPGCVQCGELCCVEEGALGCRH